MLKDQMNIFNYFGAETDPIHQKISSLEQGDSVYLGHYEITLNHQGIYEISSEGIHEGFGSVEKCYDFFQALEDEQLFITKEVFFHGNNNN